MAWINLATLLTLYKNAHRDIRRITVFVPDTDLPVPNPPRHRASSFEADDSEEESDDFEEED